MSDEWMETERLQAGRTREVGSRSALFVWLWLRSAKRGAKTSTYEFLILGWLSLLSWT